MAFDPAGRPFELKVEHADTVQTKEELKEKQEAHEYEDKRLKELVQSDEMYYALELFLLGDPKRQIEQLGDVDSLLSKGDQAKSADDHVKARYNYETAAKIEMYRQNKEGLRKCLVLSQEVTEENDKHFAFQRTILDNLDEVLRVSKQYYDTIPGSQGD
ncbi:MAG: hypothetical protein PXY39_10850 [archaeon]|nr:hypothetical protein [archaeon]